MKLLNFVTHFPYLDSLILGLKLNIYLFIYIGTDHQFIKNQPLTGETFIQKIK